MELQWPLILFTTLTAWGCGVLGGAGALALKGAGKKSQQLLAILSCVLLAAGGIAVFFHLQHWERIFNGFGHITSGITQELIAIVVFVVIAVAYFAMARKSDDGGTLPKGMAWVAIAISVILAAVCAHSYMMPARPAWDSVLEVLSIVGAACSARPPARWCWPPRARRPASAACPPWRAPRSAPCAPLPTRPSSS